MFSKVLFLFCLTLCISLFSACNPTSKLNSSLENRTEDKYTLDFPFDALGYWEGDLEIFQDTGRVQIVPMAIFISETPDPSVFSWQIIYNPGKKQDARPYLLLTKNEAKGQYQIDEDNGIILEAFLLDNRLISTYKVNQSSLTTINTFLQDNMIFEVIAGPSESISSTGNIRVEGIEIPEVKSYGVSVYQRAILKKRRG